DRVVLPEDVEELSIVECHDLRSLCDASPSLSLATRLKTLSVVKVFDCPKLKRMPFSLLSFENGRPSAPPSFRRIAVRPKEWWDAN
ncbi:hypothetical protein Tsubulata_051365, partial [Turnera subulata]